MIMKPVINYRIQVLTTGFIVLLFSSLLLFWIRFLCELSLLERIPLEARVIDIRPSKLVPPELEDDPNVVHHSIVEAILYRHPTRYLGFVNYLTAWFPEGDRSNVYFVDSDNEYMYLDKKTGQIIYQDFETQTMPDKSTIPKLVQLYAGPEGISEIPDQTFGRFDDPIIEQSESRPKMIRERIVYLQKQSCFLKIDFDQAAVTKGPDISKKSPHYKPIQIGFLSKNPKASSIRWLPPQIKVPDKSGYREVSRTLKPIIPGSGYSDAGPYLLVLDESGRIDLLDKQTLDFVGTAGRLPGPETYFGTMSSVTPKDLLSYTVRPLVLNKFYSDDGKMFKMTFGQFDESDKSDSYADLRKYAPTHIFGELPEVEPVASKINREYLGMFAASVSRNGTAMALAVFNAEGKRIKTEYTRLPQYEGRYTSYLQSSKAAFWKSPWAPASTIGKFLVENLHPPVLSIASYFTASVFEAGSGHRALFLLPNSFVAMISRDGRGNCAQRFSTALWWMTPSFILAVWLAWRIGKDATMTGLSRKTRRSWIVGAIAFGLPAYITYRLIRPKITLVTCTNCGKPRRPDMEKCHQCNSPWQIPERTPPNWRVLDGDNVGGNQVIRQSGGEIPEDQETRL